MTTHSEDILAFLDRIITERERTAQEACDGGAGRWRNGWCPEDELEEGEVSGSGVSDERDRTVVYDEGHPSKAQSVHIALHDPASVLRRCAADRRIIARHQEAQDWSWGMFGCPHDGQHTGLCAHNQTCWPCPDLVDLAEGYGWAGGAQ